MKRIVALLFLPFAARGRLKYRIAAVVNGHRSRCPRGRSASSPSCRTLPSGPAARRSARPTCRAMDRSIVRAPGRERGHQPGHRGPRGLHHTRGVESAARHTVMEIAPPFKDSWPRRTSSIVPSATRSSASIWCCASLQVQVKAAQGERRGLRPPTPTMAKGATSRCARADVASSSALLPAAGAQAPPGPRPTRRSTIKAARASPGWADLSDCPHPKEGGDLAASAAARSFRRASSRRRSRVAARPDLRIIRTSGDHGGYHISEVEDRMVHRQESGSRDSGEIPTGLANESVMTELEHSVRAAAQDRPDREICAPSVAISDGRSAGVGPEVVALALSDLHIRALRPGGVATVHDVARGGAARRVRLVAAVQVGPCRRGPRPRKGRRGRARLRVGARRGRHRRARRRLSAPLRCRLQRVSLRAPVFTGHPGGWRRFRERGWR